MPQSLRRHRDRRRGRRRPWGIGEIEEIEHVGLRGIMRRQVRGTPDEPVLDEFDYGSVVHGDMRNVVPARKWRDNNVGHTES